MPANAEMVAHWEQRISDYDLRESLLKAIAAAPIGESFWRATIGANTDD